MKNHLYGQMNPRFQGFLTEHEIMCTSWAEWRYWDNPEFCAMLMMGEEL